MGQMRTVLYCRAIGLRYDKAMCTLKGCTVSIACCVYCRAMCVWGRGVRECVSLMHTLSLLDGRPCVAQGQRGKLKGCLVHCSGACILVVCWAAYASLQARRRNTRGQALAESSWPRK